MQMLAAKPATKKIAKGKRGRKPKQIKNDIDLTNKEVIDLDSDQSTDKIQTYRGHSLPKYLRHPEEYQFLDVPIIVPSLEELKHPFKLVKRLHKEGYSKHGVVKIRPDKNMWQPKYVFDQVQKQITTRIQVINELAQGISFEQNVDSFTYESFKQKAIDFEKTYKYQTKQGISDFYRKNEYELWSVIENPDKFQEIEIEYAADLPSTKFGSAFAKDASKLKNNQGECGWHLENINLQRNSMFQFTAFQKGSELSGITNPWVYLGMKFATFCFHTEDLWMYALNYMHMGEKKTWYTVPPQFKSKFEEVYRAKYQKVFKNKPDIMYRLNLQLSPAEATRAYIPIYRTDQEPGDFMLTFPKVYHGGFSHGFNCGEAVNIASTEWIKFYREAVDDYAIKGHHKKISFPIEWLISEIITYIDNCDFDLYELTKIKEEWDFIVTQEIQFRNNVLKTYGDNLIIHEFDNKKIKYDRMVCKNCQAYMQTKFYIILNQIF